MYGLAVANVDCCAVRGRHRTVEMLMLCDWVLSRSIVAHFAASFPRDTATRDPLSNMPLMHTRLRCDTQLQARIQAAVQIELQNMRRDAIQSTLCENVHAVCSGHAVDHLT